jgi:DNA-binding response OmpR family regulator
MPVIMFSARAGKETIAEGLAEGADDYLIKPFTARELLTRVASLLRLSRLRLKAARTEKMLRMEVHLRHAHAPPRTHNTTSTNSSHAKLTRPSLLATHVTRRRSMRARIGWSTFWRH